MRPAVHALSILVPVYGYWQVWRHFAVIGAALRRVGASRPVDPTSATIGIVIWSVTFFHYSTQPLFILLDAAELAAGTAVIVYGQRALNDYWRARPGPPVPERLVETDWLALAAAAGYFVLQIAGYIAALSN